MTKRRKNSLIVLSCAMATAVSVAVGVVLNGMPVRAETVNTIQTSQYFSSSENIVVESAKSNTKGEQGISVTLNDIGHESKASFEYKNYISVEELSAGFLEMSMLPNGYGKNDCEFVIVTLTDAMDENQKLVWAATAQPDSSTWWAEWTLAQAAFTDDLTPIVQPNYGSSLLLQIEGTSQNIHGKNGPLATVNPNWYSEYMDCGQLIASKYTLFVQRDETVQLDSMKFSYSGTQVMLNNKLVADVADAEFLYQSSRFLTGTVYEDRYTQDYIDNLFSSGYCKLKVEYQGIKSNSVSCHIKSIGEQVFANNEGVIVEATSPLIKADVNYNALVGYDYKIPTAYAHDITDGELSANITVKILNESGTAVHTGFSNYKFTQAGDYILQYTVENLRGESFSKDYSIRCYQEIPKTTFGFTTEYEDKYTIGDSIILPSTIASNAAEIDNIVTADVLIQKDGQIINRYTNETNKEYVLLEEGNYAIIFRYTNAYGISDSEIRLFVVEKGVQMKVKNPISLTAGTKNTLYDFSVENYYNDVEQSGIYRAIFVNGTNVYTAKGNTVVNGSLELPSNIFTEKGVATVEYKVGFEKDNYIFAQSYKIPVIKLVYIGDSFITYNAAREFTSEGMSVVNQTMNTAFETTVNGGFMLPQPLSQESTSLVFNARMGKDNFESMTVMFENAADSSKKLSFVLSAVSETESLLTIQGKSYLISGSLINSNAKFNWLWDSVNSVLCNNKGEPLTDVVSYWDNTTRFDGFTDGIIVRFEFNGVNSDGAGIELESVANQAFVSEITTDGIQPLFDVFAPYIEIDGSYSSVKAEYGKNFTIYAARAYDVLDSNTTLYVTVTAPDGTVVLNKASCEQSCAIKINQFGKWDIRYTAYDSTGIFEQTNQFNLSVKDEQAPLLSIAQPPKTLYAVGQTIDFGKVYAFDNFTQDCKISIFVVSPDSGRELVNGQYTFKEEGVYRIVYQAVDADYNYALQSYEVKVSGGVK